jgi:hypothetical protein
VSKLIFAISICCVAIHAWAIERHLVSLPDPKEDDFGSGALIVQNASPYHRGDLDLRSVDISRDDNGFWFVVTMGNFLRAVPIDDSSKVNMNGASTLPFNFNVDIYVDTDRKSGSGNTFTLPGRKLRIDRRYAWERVIVLAPHAQAMKSQLVATLQKNFPGRPSGEAEASIDESMFFVNKINVRNKSIAFLVPKKFVGPTDGTDWAITALVTASSPNMDDATLGVLQLSADPNDVGLSYTGEKPPSPVVDALLPTVALQTRILSSGEPMTGLSWGRHTLSELAAAPVVVDVPAVASVPANAKLEDDSLLGGAWQGIKELFTEASPVQQAAAPNPNLPVWRPGQPPTPIAMFLDVAPIASVSAGNAALGQASMPQDPAAERSVQTVKAQLKALKNLYDQSLIDEAAYKKQREKILNAL